MGNYFCSLSNSSYTELLLRYSGTMVFIFSTKRTWGSCTMNLNGVKWGEFCPKSRRYKQLGESYDCIHFVLTFSLTYHILCSQLFSGVLVRRSTKAVKGIIFSCLCSFNEMFLNGKTNPLSAGSPLFCGSDFSPYVFPICCLKKTP